MRLKRTYYRNGDVNNPTTTDFDAIAVGEFPVFSGKSSVPIAYPIIAVNSEDNSRSHNYFNSYNQNAKPNENTSYILNYSQQSNENMITEDCINYLKYVFYANSKTTDAADK
jgi:hypothetical protein